MTSTIQVLLPVEINYDLNPSFYLSSFYKSNINPLVQLAPDIRDVLRY